MVEPTRFELCNYIDTPAHTMFFRPPTQKNKGSHNEDLEGGDYKKKDLEGGSFPRKSFEADGVWFNLCYVFELKGVFLMLKLKMGYSYLIELTSSDKMSTFEHQVDNLRLGLTTSW